MARPHHEVPIWVMLAPTLAMALGFAVAWYFYLTNPLVPFGLAKRFRGAYQFLLNAWYFDALYDSLFVRPAKRLGRFLWKTGDGTIIDGIGPDGVAARVIDITNRVVKLQTGYIYHYAFVMLIGVALIITYFMLCRRRAAAMSYSWPILSTVTFLPLLGALLIAALRGGDESAFRNARFIALWTTLVTFALSLVLWRDFDPTTAQFQFVEQRAWLGADQLPHGRRRHLLALRAADHLPHAALHPGELASRSPRG